MPVGITPLELRFLAEARRRGLLPRGGAILELGEAATFGIPDLASTFAGFLAEIDCQALALQQEAKALGAAKSDYQRLFGGARLFYQAIFAPRSITSVDGLSNRNSLCVDLNLPCDLGRAFDVSINNGTSEHVFNLANVFKFMHDHTKSGGVMLHWTPGVGWLDHGLYNVQPGFFFDLSSANEYEVLLAALCTHEILREIKSPDDAVSVAAGLGDALICTVLRKTGDREFRMPYQGVFRGHGDLAPFTAINNARATASPPRGPNVALGLPALQSSTSRWSFHDDPRIDASGANDGRITGHFGFHTELQAQPWWQVDLQKPTDLAEVRVYNRLTDGCAHRARFVQILLSSNGEEWSAVYSHDGSIFGGADGSPLHVPMSRSATARFVRLQLPGQEYLHLDEVEIYPAPADFTEC